MMLRRDFIGSAAAFCVMPSLSFAQSGPATAPTPQQILAEFIFGTASPYATVAVALFDLGTTINDANNINIIIANQEKILKTLDEIREKISRIEIILQNLNYDSKFYNAQTAISSGIELLKDFHLLSTQDNPQWQIAANVLQQASIAYANCTNGLRTFSNNEKQFFSFFSLFESAITLRMNALQIQETANPQLLETARNQFTRELLEFQNDAEKAGLSIATSGMKTIFRRQQRAEIEGNIVITPPVNFYDIYGGDNVFYGSTSSFAGVRPDVSNESRQYFEKNWKPHAEYIFKMRS